MDFGMHSGVDLKTLSFLNAATTGVSTTGAASQSSDETAAVASVPVSASMIVGICFNPRHVGFATANSRNVKVWSAVTGNLQRVYQDITVDDITSLCIGHDDQQLVLGDRLGHITIHNWSTGAKVRTLCGHPDHPVTFLWFCAIDRVIVSAGTDGTMLVHDDTDLKDEREPKYRMRPSRRLPPHQLTLSSSAMNLTTTASHFRSTTTTTTTITTTTSSSSATSTTIVALSDAHAPRPSTSNSPPHLTHQPMPRAQTTNTNIHNKSKTTSKRKSAHLKSALNLTDAQHDQIEKAADKQAVCCSHWCAFVHSCVLV
jgi:hypothetical protein